MIDIFRPLRIVKQAHETEDEKYMYSWIEEGSYTVNSKKACSITEHAFFVESTCIIIPKSYRKIYRKNDKNRAYS